MRPLAMKRDGRRCTAGIGRIHSVRVRRPYWRCALEEFWDGLRRGLTVLRSRAKRLVSPKDSQVLTLDGSNEWRTPKERGKLGETRGGGTPAKIGQLLECIVAEGQDGGEGLPGNTARPSPAANVETSEAITWRNGREGAGRCQAATERQTNGNGAQYSYFN